MEEKLIRQLFKKKVDLINTKNHLTKTNFYTILLNA